MPAALPVPDVAVVAPMVTEIESEVVLVERLAETLSLLPARALVIWSAVDGLRPLKDTVSSVLCAATTFVIPAIAEAL